MQKIISLFQRNYDGDHLVRNEVVPGAEWVIVGEGIATDKYDGTCCLFKDGQLFKRHELKQGKATPAGFTPAQESPDPVTGDMPGWIPISEHDTADRWHREAIANQMLFEGTPLVDGQTYELVGPKINGNSDRWKAHRLVLHGHGHYPHFPRTFDEIKAAFAKGWQGEGIVWHHSDGRMVKIKVKDFGFKRLYRELF